MKLTIIAATGGIGRQVLDQAVAAGHDVTAVLRNPAKLAGPTGPTGPTGPAGPDGRVRVVTADLAAADPPELTSAISGTDAVISSLGPRSKIEAGVVSRGTGSIVRAMRETGVRRVVLVSAGPVGTVPSPGNPTPPRHDPGDGFVVRHLATGVLRRLFGEHYADLALAEDILRDSDLDWTVVRPPRLTNKPLTGKYRTAYGRNIRRGLTIPRADVAHLMLRVLDQPETFRQTMSVAT